MQTEHFQRCLAQLKRFDHDRYLAILLTPPERREALCALFALDAELARIPDTVSEPLLGDIRFQWWRETLETMSPMGSGGGHEIALALGASLFETPVAPAGLLPLVDAHAALLSGEPHATLTDAAREQSAPLQTAISLGRSILGGERAEDQAADRQIESLVTAYGLVRLIRRLPHDASLQRLTIPLDLMGRYELDPHDIFAGVFRPGLALALGEILDRAAAYWDEGRGLDVAGDRALLSLLLPMGLTPLYLRKLREPAFDPFRQSSEIPAFRRQVRYLTSIWRKRF